MNNIRSIKGWIKEPRYYLGVLIAKVKLLFVKKLAPYEPCPLYGCCYHIVHPCPACGRHMAHEHWPMTLEESKYWSEREKKENEMQA
jgi:hypothetical protein